MAISINNIPFGTQVTQQKSEYAAISKVVSDGKVDEAFVTPGESFISSITDDRVKDFLKSNTAPGADWQPHKLGGYDSPSQSLFVDDNGRAVLRSNVEEKGRKIQHLITAPFDRASGAVDLEASVEGFQFAREGGKSAVFKIPLG